MSDKFVTSLNHASRVVAGWPEWKRNLLGRSKAESPSSDPPMIGSVTGCSTVDQSVPDAEQGGASGNRPLPVSADVTTANTPGSKTDGCAASAGSTAPDCPCRYQWVGDNPKLRYGMDWEPPAPVAQVDNPDPCQHEQAMNGPYFMPWCKKCGIQYP
jgi:hypothetical protein